MQVQQFCAAYQQGETEEAIDIIVPMPVEGCYSIHP